MKEVLQADLEKWLKENKVLYTRLRTPNYGYRGVRYPADFVLWLEKTTVLVECKQRKSLPLLPSDIRQLPFMKEWGLSSYIPKAMFVVMTSTEEGYCLFTYTKILEKSIQHKGLRIEDSYMYGEDLSSLMEALVLNG